MKFVSVKLRVLLGIVIPLLIMAGGVAGVAVWKMRATAVQDFTAKSQQELNLFGLYISQMLRTGRDTAQAVASDMDIRNGLGKFPLFSTSTRETRYRHEDLPPETRAVAERLRNMQASHRQFLEVFAGFRDGSYATSFQDSVVPAGTDMSTRSWYRECAASPGGSALSAVYQTIQNVPAVSLTHRIKGPGGEMVGVVGVDISLAGLRDIVRDFRLDTSGRFVIIEKGAASSVRPRRRNWKAGSSAGTSGTPSSNISLPSPTAPTTSIWTAWTAWPRPLPPISGGSSSLWRTRAKFSPPPTRP